MSQCERVVESVVDENTRTDFVRWNEDKVAKGDALVSKERL